VSPNTASREKRISFGRSLPAIGPEGFVEYAPVAVILEVLVCARREDGLVRVVVDRPKPRRVPDRAGADVEEEGWRSNTASS
jgi:hypothetical protein